MQSDEIIWTAINHHFCSFKVKTTTTNFCRHQKNVTGLCNRQSCPLANSNYATVINTDGKLYLCMKTIERAHSPAKLWEKVKLSKNYQTALNQIDTCLEHWPKFLIHKCKQRITKMTQVLSRSRNLALKTMPKLVAINKKIESREARREAKAEVAAKLEQSIESELLDRLRKGVYGSEGIVNEQQESFIKALDKLQDTDQTAQEDYDSDEEELEEELLDREFVSDISEDDMDDIEDSVDDNHDSDQESSSDSDKSEEHLDVKKPTKKIRRKYFIIHYFH